MENALNAYASACATANPTCEPPAAGGCKQTAWRPLYTALHLRSHRERGRWGPRLRFDIGCGQPAQHVNSLRHFNHCFTLSSFRSSQSAQWRGSQRSDQLSSETARRGASCFWPTQARPNVTGRPAGATAGSGGPAGRPSGTGAALPQHALAQCPGALLAVGGEGRPGPRHHGTRQRRGAGQHQQLAQSP